MSFLLAVEMGTETKLKPILAAAAYPFKSYRAMIRPTGKTRAIHLRRLPLFGARHANGHLNSKKLTNETSSYR